MRGNLIGTDLSGTIDLGNTLDGIEFNSVAPLATGNTIGGASANQRNVISGNNRNGVNLNFASQTTLVQGNLIGTAINGTTPLGNTSFGVQIIGSSNTISTNTIAFNTLGVVVTSATSNGNRISANSIFSNGTTAAHLGIDLGNNGVTPNDTGDGDLSANNLQNYPVITTVNTTIQGTFNSTANANFTLEFFLNPTAEPSGFGEGKTFLGSQNVTTNGSGNANFTFTPTTTIPNGQFITATATNANGDTSEFSQARSTLAPTAANVNIQGKIMSQDGRAISKAIVRLVEPSGNVRTATTNPFGYYRFLELQAGETYVLSVSHKSFEFNSPNFVITPTEDITDFVIVGKRCETEINEAEKDN